MVRKLTAKIWWLALILTLPCYGQDVYKGFSPQLRSRGEDTTNAILIKNGGLGYAGFYAIRQSDSIRLHINDEGEPTLETDTSLHIKSYRMYWDHPKVDTGNFLLMYDGITNEIMVVDTSWSQGGGSGGADSVYVWWTNADGTNGYFGLGDTIKIDTTGGGGNSIDTTYFLKTDEWFTDGWYGLADTVKIDTTGGSTNYWTLTGNYLYPNNTTDSVVIGETTPTEILDIKGNLRIHNIDSGYTLIRFGDSTVSFVQSDAGGGMYINDWNGVRITGGLVDSLRYSQIWAESEAVGMVASFSMTSWGGIFFNGGYETSWYIHEGSVYGGVSLDTNSFHSDDEHSSPNMDLGESDNTWRYTYTDFLRLTPQASPPSPATAGMIYSDTDGHLYHYDGSNWDQLDN